jgi:hypothetical protein
MPVAGLRDAAAAFASAVMKLQRSIEKAYSVISYVQSVNQFEGTPYITIVEDTGQLLELSTQICTSPEENEKWLVTIVDGLKTIQRFQSIEYMKSKSDPLVELPNAHGALRKLILIAMGHAKQCLQQLVHLSLISTRYEISPAAAQRQPLLASIKTRQYSAQAIDDFALLQSTRALLNKDARSSSALDVAIGNAYHNIKYGKTLLQRIARRADTRNGLLRAILPEDSSNDSAYDRLQTLTVHDRNGIDDTPPTPEWQGLTRHGTILRDDPSEILRLSVFPPAAVYDISEMYIEGACHNQVGTVVKVSSGELLQSTSKISVTVTGVHNMSSKNRDALQQALADSSLPDVDQRAFPLQGNHAQSALPDSVENVLRHFTNGSGTVRIVPEQFPVECTDAWNRDWRWESKTEPTGNSKFAVREHIVVRDRTPVKTAPIHFTELDAFFVAAAYAIPTISQSETTHSKPTDTFGTWAKTLSGTFFITAPRKIKLIEKPKDHKSDTESVTTMLKMPPTGGSVPYNEGDDLSIAHAVADVVTAKDYAVRPTEFTLADHSEHILKNFSNIMTRTRLKQILRMVPTLYFSTAYGSAPAFTNWHGRDPYDIPQHTVDTGTIFALQTNTERVRCDMTTELSLVAVPVTDKFHYAAAQNVKKILAILQRFDGAHPEPHHAFDHAQRRVQQLFAQLRYLAIFKQVKAESMSHDDLVDALRKNASGILETLPGISVVQDRMTFLSAVLQIQETLDEFEMDNAKDKRISDAGITLLQNMHSLMNKYPPLELIPGSLNALIKLVARRITLTDEFVSLPSQAPSLFPSKMRDFTDSLHNDLRQLPRGTRLGLVQLRKARARLWKLWNRLHLIDTTASNLVLGLAQTFADIVEFDERIQNLRMLVCQSSLSTPTAKLQTAPVPDKAGAALRSARRGRIITRSTATQLEWQTVTIDPDNVPLESIEAALLESITQTLRNEIATLRAESPEPDISNAQKMLADNLETYKRTGIEIYSPAENQHGNHFQPPDTDGANKARTKNGTVTLDPYSLKSDDINIMRTATVNELNIMKKYFGWDTFPDGHTVDELIKVLEDKAGPLAPTTSYRLKLTVMHNEGPDCVFSVAGQFTEYQKE